jgi:CheY-like chemotaxis protein
VVLAAVDRLEPACVLLDGGGWRGHDTSWEVAAALRVRARPVPAVMFTVDDDDASEARAGESTRSAAAGFGAVLPKPFDLDELRDRRAGGRGGGGAVLERCAVRTADRVAGELAPWVLLTLILVWAVLGFFAS